MKIDIDRNCERKLFEAYYCLDKILNGEHKLSNSALYEENQQLKEQLAIIEKALELACECSLSQELYDEDYYYAIEDWKNENHIETCGVGEEELIQYFKQQAKESINGTNNNKREG